MKYFCNFESGFIYYEKAVVRYFYFNFETHINLNIMMKNLLLIFCFLPMLVIAQEEDQSKYMVGAVPEVNGKVVFSKEISTPNLSKNQIFDAILAWANTRFKTDKGNWGMVAYSNKEEGQIAC